MGVVDAEGRIYGTRCGKAMFEWSRPMYRVGATRRRKRHVHPMSSFVQCLHHGSRIRIPHYIPNPNSPNPQPKRSLNHLETL